MNARLLLIVVVGLEIASCKPRGKFSDQIPGVYARETSFPVTNLESGKEIGIGTIRDTIFIQLVENGYAVSNRKWRLNDYDKEGWRSMEHSEDRPLPSYIADFIEADSSLRSKHSDLIPPLFVDLLKHVIFRSKTEKRQYERVP